MGKAHFVNLLHVPEADNPYVVEFRHNAYGDVYGREADALVAFSLDRLPDTEGKTVKLTLKWNSFSGENQQNLIIAHASRYRLLPVLLQQ